MLNVLRNDMIFSHKYYILKAASLSSVSTQISRNPWIPLLSINSYSKIFCFKIGKEDDSYNTLTNHVTSASLVQFLKNLSHNCYSHHHYT